MPRQGSHHQRVWGFFMEKCIAQRVDIILKAAGAKGIGHYSRLERCRLLGLGEPKTNVEANKLLKKWLEQFADRTPLDSNGPESAARK